jgi:NAD dependent epimerase/dehydratase family enzyme
MRTDAELALYGRYVTSSRLEAQGFEFQLPKLVLALRETLC